MGHKREREAAKRDSETRGKDSKAVAQGGTEASKGDQVGGSNARITTSAWR